MSTVAAHSRRDRRVSAPLRSYGERMLAVASVGVAPTYWLPMARGTLAVDPTPDEHALVFYGWVLLLWWQARLAASDGPA